MEEENSDEIFYGNLKISFEQQASTNVHSKHINKCIVVHPTWRVSGNDRDPPWFRVVSYLTSSFPIFSLIYSIHNKNQLRLKSY